MTTRNLNYFFDPKSVALIGANRDKTRVGGAVAANLRQGGFQGPVMLINRRAEKDVQAGLYHHISELPSAPELAVIAIPSAEVPEAISELGAMGTRAAVVVSAVFEDDQEGKGAEIQQAILEAAEPHLLRVIGPNCLGIMMPKIGLNATFAHLMAGPGKLAFVAQSGAILTAVVDWAKPRGIGFSCLVSLGDQSDVDFGDLLDYLANDWQTSGILLYVESVQNARKFMSAARLAARLKPVVVVKGGRYAQITREGSQVASLAGPDAVYSAAFRRAGLVQVDSLTELFDAVETLAHTTLRYGDRLAILSNGGGVGVLATDELSRLKGKLTTLTDETQDRLRAFLPPFCTTTNPVDILGDAPPERYGQALKVLLDAPEVDAVAVFNCPVGMSDSAVAAQQIIEVAKDRRKGLLTNWLGAETAKAARLAFQNHGIPTYETPDQTIHAFIHLIEYRRGQKMLMETPPSLPEVVSSDLMVAKAIVQKALSEGRNCLSLKEGMALLMAFGIPCVPTEEAKTPEEAASLADRIGYPVALKIASPELILNRQNGGVTLNLKSADAIHDASQAMIKRINDALPGANVSGFTVQPMVPRADAYELIIGMVSDPVFGPVILFGHGGSAVEALNDTAFALPPLNMHLARDLMGRTRIHRLLEGAGGMPPAPLDAIAMTLIKISQLVASLGEVAEIEINPLLADAERIVALDVRVHLQADNQPGDRRFAIRPYPKELEEPYVLPDGRRMILRPIQPEDEPALIRLFESMTDEERYMRFFTPMPRIQHQLAARLSQIDYDREMALVLAEDKPPGEAELAAGVRIAGDPNNEKAEYAIGVRHDYMGQGLGPMLMHKIIDYATRRGYKQVYGEIMRENLAMLAVCRKLGFTIEPGSQGNTVRAVMVIKP